MIDHIDLNGMCLLCGSHCNADKSCKCGENVSIALHHRNLERIEALEDYIDNLANRGVPPPPEWRRQGGP